MSVTNIDTTSTVPVPASSFHGLSEQQDEGMRVLLQSARAVITRLSEILWPTMGGCDIIDSERTKVWPPEGPFEGRNISRHSNFARTVERVPIISDLG
jgi:hypothetical protein